ncbi:hypothetical protein KUV35_04840 [Marinobacter salsuginis]|jgi:membrane-bound metal-dependent hydrolase YbcI (DUF457 family)|uniref:Uncharacterized protein n=1 Tax=Marinobacter maroccanus TaxID=2055143 RepID=A0A2S5ZFY0_9GAMM|nr:MULTISPECIES: hypothetical protein [Marinobacter]MBY6070606.1 hypothetical protein [Marinobacter salsuginis]PPI86198.1 hypothetical protein KEHDKFFH_02440 [Marinobacter maroccanus]|tara:strand:- start:104 stop:298 length:195 start_codon:yes stop_codon:yes gene_type:complete
MLISILTFLVGLAGALLLAFGSWLVFPPAGYIVGGLLCLVWSFMSARALAVRDFQANRQQRGDS